MKELTEKQQRVLEYICSCMESNSHPPTVREIALHFGVTPHAIQVHLNALRKKGWLEPSDKRSRVIQLSAHASVSQNLLAGARRIPLLGTVAAGKPVFCEENYEGFIELPESQLRRGSVYFALSVRGESMINAGILDGDTAIVEKTQTARNGQIVVALINDSVTLKRFFKEKSRVLLCPENPAFSTIYCQELSILGILACILRTY